MTAHSILDRLIINLDNSLRTLVPGAARAGRENPASKQPRQPFDDAQRKHIAGLMRINHTGEVCAQGLYQGQAMTARLSAVRDEMQQAADEEIDHLQWCEQRLTELDSHTSLLNPFFYAASFTIGAAAGALGDKWSLGFVAATEEQVCKHLSDHLEQLPEGDQRSRAILEQMKVDEERHGHTALEAGGVEFSPSIKNVMTLMSKVMTHTTYRI